MWTASYVEAVHSGRTPSSPWRHAEIVAGLDAETHSKCAYCEAVIGDVAHPHVEHIIPKSVRPELVVRWDNLTLACPQCNNGKGAYYDPDAPLLHPYEDEPGDHLVFQGPAIYAVHGSEVGTRTINRLKLMRSALLLERARAIEKVDLLLRNWAGAEGPDKEMWAQAVRDELGDDKEFAQTLRAFAARFNFPM